MNNRKRPGRQARWLRRLLLALLALLILLGLGLWLAPAAALQAWLSMQQHPLQLHETSGRLLHGSAQRAQWQGLDLGRLDWQVIDSAPLSGQVEVDFKVDGRDSSLAGQSWLGSDGAVRARDITGRLPAIWIDLTSLLPLVFPVGNLEFDLPRLEYSPGQLPLADGQVRWQDAGLTGLARARFGDILIDLDSGDNGLDARLESQPGAPGQPPADILVDGTLWSDGADYRASLGLRVHPSRPDLRRLLEAIARPAADGSLRLDFAGKLFPAPAGNTRN